VPPTTEEGRGEGEAHSQPSDGAAADDYDFYGDQDDAQSFIQPAISPMATRLTLPKTPAAERAAAMDKRPGGGFFDMLDPGTDSGQHSVPPRDVVGNGDMAYDGQFRLPTPWQAGPKQLIITGPTTSRMAMSSMSAVFGGGHASSRHQRSSSVSENALKRLSKALPSMPSISIHTPSFFSLSSSQKDDSEYTTDNDQLSSQNGHSFAPETGKQASPRPQSSRLSYAALRKSTSDDSLLYHSLSRVSSLGDDDRFVNIREQVNSRFKAIKDSWDGPLFKMPQFPNILNAPLKKAVGSSSGEPQVNGYRPSPLKSGQRVDNKDGVPPLDLVLESLTGDIVVMGGYRGSILRSAHPPFRQLWVPVKVGLNIRKVNMEVGLEPEDEERMEEHIFASGMLQNIGPVDISRRLFKKLRECDNARTGKLRVHDFGYDWRLSPHLLSRRLIQFLEKLPSNQPGVPVAQRGAWVISHSLGGLITRHAVNMRPELFAGIVYAGVPQRCINILGPLRNGDAVLLNEKVLTAQVHFSLRTTFAFLPEDGFCFIDKVTKEEYPVDFYNIDDWVKYRLCPCIGEPVHPPLLRSSTFTSLLGLSESLPSLPLRNRSSSLQKRGPNAAGAESSQKDNQHYWGVDLANNFKDRTLAPQMAAGSSGNGSGSGGAYRDARTQSMPVSSPSSNGLDSNSSTTADQQVRNMAYLRRTLAETKKFRSELAHAPAHQEANAYPPLGVIYAKDIPTVYAARVAGAEGIACADAYDDLVFRSGDGVVLARESMLPQGYELVKDGRICTDRGHVTLLGDLAAVGRALEAVVRGRRKGIGMGAG
ncbi:hypothetical protein B0T17DRAFT_454966, partial [Bombardia bombarda]